MPAPRIEDVMAGFAQVAQDFVSVDTKAEAAPKSFSSRVALQASSAGPFQIAEADGVLYRRQTGMALPGLNNWRPLDNTLDIRHVGSTSELSSDFVGRFSQAVDDAAENGWDLRVSQKPDGTPYEYQHIDHTLTDDLRIRFNRNALFMPRTNFQHFPTNGATGPFQITAWPYDAAVDGTLSAMLVSGTTETKLDQGTGFTLSGNAATLTATPPAGSVFVVVARNDALRFRSTPGNGRRLILDGDINIDLSRLGYAIASASGSALSVSGVDHIVLERLWAYSPAGYGGAPLAKRGDSAFVPSTFKTCYAGRIHADGMNDLAVYATGGASSGYSDDATGLYIGSIQARRCSTAMKYVRQGEQAYVGSIFAEECGTMFLVGETDGLATGHGIHIGSLNGIRIARRALDLRAMPKGGFHVGAVSIRDIGFMPDGVTPGDTSAGVFMSGVSGAQIDYLDIRQRDWPTPANVPAALVSGSDNMGNRILGGWIEGLDAGVRETGATTNDVGNSYTMTLKNVATPIDSAGALQTDFDLTVLTTSGGTVTSRRLNSLVGEKLSGTPTFQLAGATNSPAYAYQLQNLVYQKVRDFTLFSLQIQGNITHTETGGQFRVLLPAALNNKSAAPVPLTVGRATGISSAEGPLTAEIPAGQNYILFHTRPSGGGSPVQITSDVIATGVTIRIELAGVVPV